MTGARYISTVFFLAFAIGHFPSLAQADLRSHLVQSLDNEKDVFKKVDLLNELSYNYFDVNDTIARSYAQQALQLATKLTYQKGIKYATLLEGVGYFGAGVFDSAIVRFQQSLLINDTSGVENDVYAMALIGECLTTLARYDSADVVFQTALATAKKAKSYWLPRIYVGRARIALKKWENQQALELLDSARRELGSERIDYRRLELLAILSEVQDNLLQVDSSAAALDELCLVADSLNDRYYLIKCDLQNADFYFARGDFSEALTRIRSALDHTKTYYYPVQQAQLFIEAGNIYVQIAEFDLALDYFFKALEIAEPLGLKAEIATIYSKIAWVFKEENKLDLATDYARRSLELCHELGDRYGIAYNHNTLGLIFFLENRFEDSMAEFEASLAIRRSIGYHRGVVATLFNQSLVLEQRGETEKALAQLMLAMEQAKPMKNALSQANLYRGAAELLIKLRRYGEAANLLKTALELGTRGSSKLSLRNTYQTYSKLYEATGDFKKALDFRKKYESLNDSIFSDNSARRIAELQGVYELKQKENEIDGLKKQRQLQEEVLQLQHAEIRDQKLQLYITVFFLSLLVSFVVVLIYLYRKLNQTQKDLTIVNTELKKANEVTNDVNNNLEQKVAERTSQLRQAYAELDTFFYRSSHDFRRPLTTLMGLADVAGITIKDRQSLDLFKMVRTTAENLDKMLYKLQSISDIGAMELSFKNVMIQDLIDNSIVKYKREIEESAVRVMVDVDVPGAVTTYPVLVSIILDNLVENALNFSSRNDPYVKISAFLKEDMLVLEVEDNGQGIPDQHKSNIFAMYFKATEKSKGNGLGLYIVSKAAEKLSAKIYVETAFDKGSRFTVEIPDCVDIESAVLV